MELVIRPYAVSGGLSEDITLPDGSHFVIQPNLLAFPTRVTYRSAVNYIRLYHDLKQALSAHVVIGQGYEDLYDRAAWKFLRASDRNPAEFQISFQTITYCWQRDNGCFTGSQGPELNVYFRHFDRQKLARLLGATGTREVLQVLDQLLPHIEWLCGDP